MPTEKIEVRVTESGKTVEVVVLSKQAERIKVILGEGDHSVNCELTPTRTGRAYVGTVMGREIVYERSRAQIQSDLDKANQTSRQSRPR